MNETSVPKQYTVMTYQRDFKEIFNSTDALNKYFKHFYCGQKILQARIINPKHSYLLLLHSSKCHKNFHPAFQLLMLAQLQSPYRYCMNRHEQTWRIKRNSNAYHEYNTHIKVQWSQRYSEHKLYRIKYISRLRKCCKHLFSNNYLGIRKKKTSSQVTSSVSVKFW